MIIAFAIFIVTILVRMTSTIPSQITKLYNLSTNLTMKCEATYLFYRDSTFYEILRWIQFLIFPIFQLLTKICWELIYDITIAPIYFWKLCWNPKGRSIWQMLCDPDGGEVRLENTIKQDDTKSTRIRYRARPESKAMMRKRKAKSKGRNVEVEPIKGYRSDLYMHSYYQIDPASINQMDGNPSAEDNSSIESSEHAMALTLYFASTFHFEMNIIFPRPPKEPLDGIITALIMIPIMWICTVPHITMTCIRIMKHECKHEKRIKSRKRSSGSQACRNLKKKSRRALK